MSNVIAEDTVAIKVQLKQDGTFVVQNLQDKIKKSTENIKGHFNSVNATVKNVLKTIASLAASALLVTSLSGAVRNLVQDTISFEREFTQVRTLLDESKVNVVNMRQEILGMAGSLGDVQNITRGTYQMISSGQDAESALKNIGEAAKFAQGGQVALRDAVSVGTVYLNAYGEAAGGLSHIYDVLWQTIKDGVTTAPELAHAMGRVVPVAKEAGFSIEEVSGSIAVMTQISQNTNESVTALRGIISEIIKPSEEAAKEAERLGINFSIAGVKSMGFSNWLQDLLEKVRMNDGDMAKLWGRVDALNGVFQLTRNNLSNFSEEMKKFSQVTGNNEEAFRKYKESFQGAWETMKNRLQAIFIQNILPLLKDAANWISQNSEKIESFVKSAIEGLKSVIKFVAQFKDVIIIAGKAWLTYFAVSKILPILSQMKAGIFGVTSAINTMNTVTQAGNARTIASFGGMVNYMRTYQSQAQTANNAFLQIMGANQAAIVQTKNSLGGMVAYMQRSQGVGVKAFSAIRNSVNNLVSSFSKLPTSIKIGIAIAGLELLDYGIDKLKELIGMAEDNPFRNWGWKEAAANLVSGNKLFVDTITGMSAITQMAETIDEKISKGIELTKTEIEFLDKHTDMTDESINALKHHKEAKQLLNDTYDQFGKSIGNIIGVVGNYVNALNRAALGVKDFNENFSKWFQEQHKVNDEVKKSAILLNTLKATIGSYTKEALEIELKTLKEKGKLNDDQIKQIKDLKSAYENLASSMGILTKEGYAEQSKEINMLLGLYGGHKDMVIANEEILKKWIERVDELAKTALPGEKERLEEIQDNLQKVYAEKTKVVELYIDEETRMKRVAGAAGFLNPALGSALNLYVDSREAIIAQANAYKDMGLVMAGLLTRQFFPLNSALINAAQNTEHAKEENNKLTEAFNSLAQSVDRAIDLLQKLGIISSNLASLFSGVTEGVNAVTSGLEAWGKASALGKIAGKGFESILGKISAGIGIFSGAVSIGTSIFKGFISLFTGDKIGRIIEQQNGWMNLSDSLKDSIRELEKELKSVSAATSMHMGQIIEEANLTVENFARYAKRVRQILRDFDQGKLDLQQTTQAIGEGFNALIAEAQRLGTEGTKEMIELISDVRARGMDVAEIYEYTNQKLEQTVSALSTYLSTFTDISSIQEEIAALNEELAAGSLNAQETAQKNELLIEKQAELSLAIQDVSSNWEFMQAAAASTFHALESQGYSFFEITYMMKGELSTIAQFARESGLEISEGLRAMTNLAAFIEQHEELSRRIESTRLMMEGLGDSAFLTEQDFSSFAHQTVAQFQEIIKHTEDQEMALRLIGPSLSDLIKYAESYGYTIDEDTQALIDMGREEGVLHDQQKSHYEIQNELLLAIADALGAKIPEGLRRLAGDVEVSMGNITNQTNLWSGSLGQIQNQFGDLQNQVSDFNKFYDDIMVGHSIVTVTSKWKKELQDVEGEFQELPKSISSLEKEYCETIFNMSDATRDSWLNVLSEVIMRQEDIDAETANLKANYIYTMSEMRSNTEYWQNALAEIEAEMANATEEEIPKLMERYNNALANMESDTNDFMQELIDIGEQLGIEIPDELTSLQEKYEYVMDEMNLSTEDLIGSFRELLELYGQLEYGGMGSNYGVYTQEEKEAMTAEFITMKNLWLSNWETIVSSEDNMRRFFNDLKSLEGGILDEFTHEYGSFFDLIRQELGKVQMGYYSGAGGDIVDNPNPDSEDTGFSSGGWFLVPPGYPDDSYRLPLNSINVESGELIRIYSRRETEQLLPFLSQPGSDSTPLSPLEIPTQTLHDFYNPEIDYNFGSEDDEEDIQLNDGLEPVFVPGQTGSGEKKIEINVNLKIENIEIKIENEGDTEDDTEKIQQVFAEMIDDNFRGIGDKIADAVARKLKEVE